MAAQDRNEEEGHDLELGDHRKFVQLEQQDPSLHAFARQAVQLERDDLFQQLSDINETGPERDQILRELWVINGILDIGLDSELLQQCAEEHRKRGTVPTDYSKETTLRKK